MKAKRFSQTFSVSRGPNNDDFNFIQTTIQSI